jgi:flagellar motor switch protein FliM
LGSTQFKYTRNIKLGPAIGDWTTIQFKDLDLDEINISSVRNINFDSLPRDEMKIVHMLHYRLAELITKKLSNDLTAKVELHSVEAKQMRYGEFLDSQQEQIVQSKYLLNDLGKMDVILDWALSEMLVDRLLGGQGVPDGREKFGEIELKILKTQLEEIIPLFNDSWGNILGDQNVSDEFSSGTYAQDKKLSYREAYVLFSLNFYFIDQNLHTITFAYPNSVLKHLLKLKKSKVTPTKRRIKLNPETEKRINIPVKALIGDASLTMKELMELQIGDVIPLKSTLETPIQVLIGGETAVTGQVGIINDQIAVQIVDLRDSDKIAKSDVHMVEKSEVESQRLRQDKSISDYSEIKSVDCEDLSNTETTTLNPTVTSPAGPVEDNVLEDAVGSFGTAPAKTVQASVSDDLDTNGIGSSDIRDVPEVGAKPVLENSLIEEEDALNQEVKESTATLEEPPIPETGGVEETEDVVEDSDSEADDDFSWDDLDDEF